MTKKNVLPYGRQSIFDDDIEAVVDVLRSEWLTTGPFVEKFEAAVTTYTGSQYGVAMSSGTACLHAAMFSLGIGPGDEVIVTPMTFAASANCILYQGGTPVFADVTHDTLLIDPVCVEAQINSRTRAIIAVDYAGHPCDWDALRAIADRHHLALIADSCHSLGACYKTRKVGTLADITVFSFHPVKHITTGEGGMAVTNDLAIASRMRSFRNHGISTSARERDKSGTWFYEMTDLGYNYRITDFQCALGVSQLKKLDVWLGKRNKLACIYDDLLANRTSIKPLFLSSEVYHAYHLYVVRAMRRNHLYTTLRSNGVCANVHYLPVYMHPYYQNLGYKRGICPVAESAFDEIITLPLWPGMQQDDVKRVCSLLEEWY